MRRTEGHAVSISEIDRRQTPVTTDFSGDLANGKFFSARITNPLFEQVEKQEKKKLPKGRAKKRLTYTRRFVNVTLTGGKRKMNPNPTS